MAYPDATIYSLDGNGISTVAYEETEHYQITKSFLADRQRYFKHLFSDDEASE
jgi:predicted ATPase